MFREILFYESAEGQKPIQQFLDKLDGKQAKKIAWTLTLIVVVISHAFQKKSQKTPKQAIDLAEQRKKDYFRRKK